MSEKLEHDRFEALSRRMEDVAQRMEERIEEYLELSRSVETGGGEGGAEEKVGDVLAFFDDTIAPFRPVGFGGGVAVGVPQFFEANHLASVNEAYGGIEDFWLRGRMALWNAQMRIAQGAGDLEAMCLFLQLQLEGLTHLALKPLYVEGGRWKRSWSADLSFESTEAVDGKNRTTRELRQVFFEKGSEVAMLPYHDFAFQVNVDRQPGSYYTVIEIPEQGVPFDGREFNEKSWNRFLHEVTVGPIGGQGETRSARIVTPVKSLSPILFQGDIIWATHHVFADEKNGRQDISRGRWAVALESHWTQGLKLKIQEQDNRKFRYRTHINTNEFVDGFPRLRNWRIYASHENAFWDTALVHELSVRSYPQPETKDFQWMIDDSGVISTTTFRRSFKAGDSYDVLGRFGKNHAHISKKFDMMMLAANGDLELSWEENDRRVLDRIREVRNLLAHGNLVKRYGRSNGLNIEDVATFWDTHIQPRIPYWIEHISK